MARSTSIPPAMSVAIVTLAYCAVSVALLFYLGLPSTSLRGAWSATALACIAILAILLLANRRHRFGLRALLFGLTIVSVMFAMLSASIDKSRRQRKAIDAIAAFGGSCLNLGGAPPELVWLQTPLLDRDIATVHRVRVANSSIRDSDLSLLQPFSDLTLLDVTNTGVSDAGLRHLIGHTKLKSLYISGSRVTTNGVITLFQSQGRRLDEALTAIGFEVESRPDGTIHRLSHTDWDAISHVLSRPEAANLEVLNLSLATVPAQDFAMLKHLTNLRVLSLPPTKITEQDAATIAHLTNLQGLGLSSVEVTNRELEQLKPLKNLRHLNTTDTDITFSGVKRLFVELQGRDITEAMSAYGWTTRPGSSLTHTLYCDRDSAKDADLEEIGQILTLEILVLNSVHVTDAGTKHLSNLTQLRRLYLRNTQVTGNGLQQVIGLTKLERLDLMGSRGITSDALLQLPNRDNLVSINLLSTGIDRAAVTSLRTMSRLQELSISASVGLPSDFVSLRRALPKTAIEILATEP